MTDSSIGDILDSDTLTLDLARKIILVQQEQIAELRAELQNRNPTSRLDEPYSVSAEEKRQERKKRNARKNKNKNKRSRMKTADKVALAARTETVYPEGIAAEDCRFSHHRVAWRLENGTAVLVAYEIHRYRNAFGKPDGLVGKSEFGIEIMLALAYQVYIIGVSIDKACQLLNFFEQLILSKSQADALLNQIARVWEAQFETLCALLADSAVVHCDETSWSINSVWAFLNDRLTVVFYGVHKDGQTLQQILDKETFSGVLVSDNATVYQGFTWSQKCWAHLLRKAIKLTLQEPDNAQYRAFTDGLLAIYRRAKKSSSDGRLGDAGRARRVTELDDEIVELCGSAWADEDCSGIETENDYRRLCTELMKLMIDQELFVFVVREDVEGTNNASERQLRGDAIARHTGRTSKTPQGARRQSIISSVLQSIGKQLPSFQLQSVIDEVKRWTAVGQSCFEAMLGKPPDEPTAAHTGILEKLIIQADA